MPKLQEEQGNEKLNSSWIMENISAIAGIIGLIFTLVGWFIYTESRISVLEEKTVDKEIVRNIVEKETKEYQPTISNIEKQVNSRLNMVEKENMRLNDRVNTLEIKVHKLMWMN